MQARRSKCPLVLSPFSEDRHRQKTSHLTDGVVVVELVDEGVPVVLVVVDAVVAVLLDVDDEPVRCRSRRGVRHLH